MRDDRSLGRAIGSGAIDGSSPRRRGRWGHQRVGVGDGQGDELARDDGTIDDGDDGDGDDGDDELERRGGGNVGDDELERQSGGNVGDRHDDGGRRRGGDGDDDDGDDDGNDPRDDGEAAGATIDLDGPSGAADRIDHEVGRDDDAWTSAHGVEPIDEERAFAAGMTADDVVDFADRHYRPSRWGRVDLSLSWERAVVIRGAPEPAAYRVDEVWLRAAWRL